MNTANTIVYFCDACKRAYRASRANNVGLIVSVLKGLVAFFCGFSVQVVENVPARVSGENDRENSIITHQVPDKNILTERNVSQEGVFSQQADLNEKDSCELSVQVVENVPARVSGENDEENSITTHQVPDKDILTERNVTQDGVFSQQADSNENEKIVDDGKPADRHENLSGASNNDAMPESDQVIARKVLKKWKGYQRRGHPHLMPLLSHQKRIRAMTLAKKIKSRKKRPWGKEVEGGLMVNKPYYDREFGLVIKPGAYCNSHLSSRTDNVKHAVMISNVITGRDLNHLYVPAKDFFKIEDFGMERRPPPNCYTVNNVIVDTVVIEEYVRDTLNVDTVPKLYSQNPERFAGVASDMTQLVHAGVYMADLIQCPTEKQYRTFILNGFRRGRTPDDWIQEKMNCYDPAKKGRREDIAIDVMMDMEIRYDNLLFRDVGKEQLQGVLVDIDDVTDANKLSVEDRYLDLFIMFYDNYDVILDTIERLGVTLSQRQKQLFRFASDLSRQMMHRMPEKMSFFTSFGQALRSFLWLRSL